MSLMRMVEIRDWVKAGHSPCSPLAPAWHELKQMHRDGLLSIWEADRIGGPGSVLVTLTPLGHYDAERQAAYSAD